MQILQVLHTYTFGPRDNIKIDFAVDTASNPVVIIDATVELACPNEVIHSHHITGDIEWSELVPPGDLDDFEWALRGNETKALALAWRLIAEIVAAQGDPCEG